LKVKQTNKQAGDETTIEFQNTKNGRNYLCARYRMERPRPNEWEMLNTNIKESSSTSKKTFPKITYG